MNSEEQKVEEVIRKLDGKCILCSLDLRFSERQCAMIDVCNKHLLEFSKKGRMGYRNKFVYKELKRRDLVR